LIEDFQDNLMFETDFPHETSLQANGKNAIQVAQACSDELEQSVARKVLSGNAKRLYKLDNVP
jgi:predicted TIM-barrel fold metal-dependent hydrolase